jgi:hypothetical protein
MSPSIWALGLKESEEIKVKKLPYFGVVSQKAHFALEESGNTEEAGHEGHSRCIVGVSSGCNHGWR